MESRQLITYANLSLQTPKLLTEKKIIKVNSSNSFFKLRQLFHSAFYQVVKKAFPTIAEMKEKKNNSKHLEAKNFINVLDAPLSQYTHDQVAEFTDPCATGRYAIDEETGRIVEGRNFVRWLWDSIAWTCRTQMIGSTAQCGPNTAPFVLQLLDRVREE